MSAASVAIAFPLAALVVGWALLRRVADLDAEERFIAAAGVGIAVIAGAQFLAFAAGLPQAAAVVAVPLIAVAGGLACGRREAPPASARRMQPRLLVLFLLAYLQLLLIEAVLPLMAGGNWYFDWWMHYDEALIFLGERDIHTVWSLDATIASRNPLFNLAVAAPMALAGAHFWTYQTAVAATNVTVVMGLYLVLRTLFGRRIAFFGVGLACLNIWLMHLAWFTWSKTLVAFYLLMALHFHLRSVQRPAADSAGSRFDFAAFWLASMLAFLTHQLAAPYVAALLVHGLVRAHRAGDIGSYLGPKRMAAYGVATLALLAPWYGWLVAHIGLARMTHSSPLVAMNVDAVTALGLLRSMALNVLHSIAPTYIDLPRSPRSMIQGADLYRWLTKVYFNQVIGAVTLSQILFLLVLLKARLMGPPLRALRGRAPDASSVAALAMFGVVGLLLSLPLHPRGDAYGTAPANLFPAVLALLVWTMGLVGRFAGRRVLLLVLAATAVEYLVLFWTHLEAVAWLDPIAVNAELKSAKGLLFLADILGDFRWSSTAVLLLVQFALCGVLARRLFRSDIESVAWAPGEAGVRMPTP